MQYKYRDITTTQMHTMMYQWYLVSSSFSNVTQNKYPILYRFYISEVSGTYSTVNIYFDIHNAPWIMNIKAYIHSETSNQ